MSIQENAERLFGIAEALPVGLADASHGHAADMEPAAQGVFHAMASIPAMIVDVLGESHGATPELTGHAQRLSTDAENIAARVTQLETDSAVLGGELNQLAEQLRDVARSFMS